MIQIFPFSKQIWKEYSNRLLKSDFTTGNFENGFISGSFGSFTGSLTNGIDDPILQIGASATAGGLGSRISGGDFWEGFAVGGIVSGTNHGLHKGFEFINSLKEFDVNPLMEKLLALKVGTTLTGDELSQWDPNLNNAKYAIKSITRKQGGISINKTLSAKILAGKIIKYQNESLISINKTTSDLSHSIYKLKTGISYHVNSPGNMINFYGIWSKVNFYLYKNIFSQNINFKNAYFIIPTK